MSFDSQTTLANRHDFTTTFTAEYEGPNTIAAMITPTAGYHLIITGATITCEGGTAGAHVKLSFATSANTVYLFHPAAGPISQTSGPVLIPGATNEALSLTSTVDGAKTYFLTVNYREEI